MKQETKFWLIILLSFVLTIISIVMSLKELFAVAIAAAVAVAFFGIVAFVIAVGINSEKIAEGKDEL